VPTPLEIQGPRYLLHHLPQHRKVAARFHPGQLVVLESTTYPETTEELLLPIFRRGGQVGQDFFLAFSPERSTPGTRRSGRRYHEGVGGVTSDCTRLLRRLREIVHACTSLESEGCRAAKLYENVSGRQHPLANEFRADVPALGVSAKEVIDAAATKPLVHALLSRARDRGHCIPVDPLYLAWKLRVDGYESRFIALADEINRSDAVLLVR